MYDHSQGSTNTPRRLVKKKSTTTGDRTDSGTFEGRMSEVVQM